MQIHAMHAAISLEPEQSLRIESRREVEIGCLSGLLWVTQPGDPRDLFVAAGQSVRVAPSGLTLITATQSAVLRAVELTPARGTSGWRRWWEYAPEDGGRSCRRVRARIGGL